MDFITPFNAILGVKFSEESGIEPITLAQVKAWARIDIDDDNTLLTDLITVARQMCEQYTNISFITREVEAVLNNSLGGSFLPYGPVIDDIISIEDEDEEDITDYKITNGDFKQLKYPYDTYVKISYRAGYETLPKSLKTALVMQVAYLYENRGDEQKAAEISPMAKTILKLVRRV